MKLRLVIPNRDEVDSDLSVARPWWQFSVRFNVAISQSIPIARMHERESEGVMMRWGLAQNRARGGVNFTARGVVRSAALQSAQTVRTLWVHGQRGIVPAAGFYLWQRTSSGHQQPYYIRLVNRPVFGIAALWDRVETDAGEVIESCALIAVNANALLAEIETTSGQMPGILRQRDYDTWLSSTVPEAQQLLQPYLHTQMICHPVAPHVNYLEFDEPGLIKPAART
jgi:putative SOS response-associated peptidase YedK